MGWLAHPPLVRGRGVSAQESLRVAEGELRETRDEWQNAQNELRVVRGELQATKDELRAKAGLLD